MARIAFVGNVASMSYLLAMELIRRGHEVDIYSAESILHTNGLTNRPLSKKYGLPFERTVRKHFFKFRSIAYDIELRSSENRMLSAKYSVPIFNGSDLRSGSIAVEYPCFYTTRDLPKYFENDDRIRWLPRCADIDRFIPVQRPKKSEEIFVGHFPSDPAIKGTENVKLAVDILNRKGYRTSLIMNRIPHDHLPSVMSKCHIICDWFNPLYGLYGILSIESLLMDRPVVCYVKEENYD
jgi:hypothetical protein